MRFTKEEKKALLEMRKSGMSLRKIAIKLGRPLTTVKRHAPPIKKPAKVHSIEMIRIPLDDRDLHVIPNQIDADDIEWMRRYRAQFRARNKAVL